MEVHECRGVKEKAMLINVVLMQCIGTGKVQGGAGVRPAGKASHPLSPGFILVLNIVSCGTVYQKLG